MQTTGTAGGYDIKSSSGAANATPLLLEGKALSSGREKFFIEVVLSDADAVTLQTGAGVSEIEIAGNNAVDIFVSGAFKLCDEAITKMLDATAQHDVPESGS